jgi:HEAT repeat protein
LFEVLGKAREATPGALALMKETALYSMEPHIRGSAVRGLEGVLGEKAVDLLERVAKSWFSRRQTKEFALCSLALFESPLAQRRIAGILEPFIERAAEKRVAGAAKNVDGATLIGRTAVDALARLPIEFGLDPMLRHLGKRNAVLDCSIEGHLVFLCASGARIGPRLEQELDGSLTNPGRTAALIRILSALHDTDVIAHIVDILGIEFPQLQKRLVYGAVANAVGSNRAKVDDTTVRSLRDFAGSEDPVTAEYAIVALSRLPAHAHSSLILLRRFLKPNEDSNVARAACTAMGELRLRAAIPDLQAVLKNPFMPPTVAEAARKALERLVE